MTGTTVHPSAIVEPGARLGEGVRIGPFCHVGPDVTLGDGVELVSHVVVAGVTTIGAGTKVFPQAVLGQPPQNVKHKGGKTILNIGRDCLIREAATIHTGTDTGHGVTTVGDRCMLMAYTHVAHDCIVGNNVTFANNATLAGHCEVGDFAILGGMSAVHQFTRIGHHAFIGGASGIEGDVIPYGMAVGNRARLRGLNIIGLKRSGLARAEIHALRRAYRLLFDPARTVAENVGAVRDQFPDSAAVADILDFITSRGKRHFCVPALGAGLGDDDDGAE